MKLRIILGLVVTFCLVTVATVGAEVLGTRNWAQSGTIPKKADYIDFDIVYTTPSPYAYIFDSLHLYDGDTGTYTANMMSDPDFSTFASRLTDGVPQMLEFWWKFDWGYGGGSGSYEFGWSDTPPGGLVGCTVEAVELVVKTMTIQNLEVEDWGYGAGNYSWVAGNWAFDIDVRILGTPPQTPVPEPTTMLLLGSGLVGLAGLRRKFKRS